MMITRRSVVLACAALASVQAWPSAAQTLPSIHVVKDPGCPCCNAWIGYLRDNDFPISFEERSIKELEVYKRDMGVPEDLASCHTATVDGYVLEGHVPVADIHRLLQERPDAIGLSVPDMPFGSPGMGPETEREAYDVILIGKDGRGTRFTRYPAA